MSIPVIVSTSRRNQRIMKKTSPKQVIEGYHIMKSRRIVALPSSRKATDSKILTDSSFIKLRQKLRQFGANLSPEEAKEYSKIISGQSSPAQASILHSLYEYLEQED